MLAALNDSADKGSSVRSEAGGSQTAASSDQAVSLLQSGNLPHIETATQTLAEKIQLPNTQSAPASATLARTDEHSELEAAREAKENSASCTASVAVHSVHAKPGAVDQPPTVRSRPSLLVSPSGSDAATAIAQFIQPVQPAVASANPASRGLVSDSAMAVPETATQPRAVAALSSGASARTLARGTSSTASVADQSEHAKHDVVNQATAEESAPLDSGSPSLNDAATAIAARLYTPDQPPMLAQSPANRNSHLPAVIQSSANSGGHAAIANANPAPRGPVSNPVLPAQETEPTAQNAADRLPEAPAAAIDETSAPRSVVASRSAEMAEDRQVVAAGRVSSQPTASLKGISSAIPAASSTPSALENGAASPLSSVSDAEMVRPQVGAARAVTTSPGVRVQIAGASTMNPAAVPAAHSQFDATTAGTAAVRDAGSALPSNPSTAIPAQTTSGTSMAETFAALDGANGAMQPTWIHAGPHQAEAGFQDPVLGWVSVRAGMDAGGISAVVTPGSADATTALGAHMAGLHDYLQEQHSPVESLSLAQNPGSDAGLNQGMQQDQQQSAGGSGANANVLSSIEDASSATNPAQAPRASGGENPAILPGTSGRYISVMA
jgi:hypothetical protein